MNFGANPAMTARNDDDGPPVTGDVETSRRKSKC